MAMRYAFLVYTDERLLPQLLTSEMSRQYGALRRELMSGGQLRIIARLATTDAATTVRVRDGQILITDGPFAETREQLGGFLVAEFGSHEEATDVASRVPRVAVGCVEVRPVAAIGSTPQTN
jgi:hypothetical protein